jgi:hypothetical protein
MENGIVCFCGQEADFCGKESRASYESAMKEAF